MSGGAPEFLEVSRRFLELLGPEGLGSEYEQHDYAIAGHEPRWVLLPASVEQCAAALRVCSELGLAVVPAGFGRRLRQGNPPERFDVTLALTRMNRIVDHAAEDMTLVVEAGASLAGVNGALGGAGQWLPFDPPFARATSIGGLLAANACGPCRQGFGTPRESLIGLRAVLADGTVVASGGRVVKNVAGYDLHRLLVGSFGTLAVIVEASFKCRPRPERTGAFETRGGLRSLLGLASAVAASPLAPIFLEVLFDDATEARFVAGFAGVPEQVEWAAGRLAEMAIARGLETAGEVAPAFVGERIEAIADAGGASGEALVLRAGTRPADLGDWLEFALAALARGGGRVAGHAHAGVGVARLRIEGGEESDASRAIAPLRDAARSRGGYLVIESSPAGAALDVWGPPPEGFHLMRDLKASFDPRGLLAPGRFVGGL